MPCKHPPPPLPFPRERKRACNNCEHGVDGICLVRLKTHPDQADLKTLLALPSSSCPIDTWSDIPVVCPNCRRMIVISEVYGICSWCLIKQNLNIRNGHRRGVPDTRSHIVEPRPFTDDPIKHLHYFLYPRYEESTRYHLDQLRQSVEQFNGRKICCVVTDSRTHQDSIRNELEDIFTHVYEERNDPSKREGVGFIKTLEMLQSRSENEVICFAHGKGQQRGTSQSPVVRLWMDTMYEVVVRNWTAVRDAMEEGYPLVGAFKVRGSFRSTPYKWHYSGTFFWARSASVFGNPIWRQMCNTWWQSESYVGRHWLPDEGYCLLGDGVVGGSISQQVTWDERLNEELKEWRERHWVT